MTWFVFEYFRSLGAGLDRRRSPRPILPRYTFPEPSNDYWDLRLHATEAKTFVDNLIANPGNYATYFSDVRLSVIITTPNLESQYTTGIEVGQKCRDLGIPVWFGFRCMDEQVPTFAAGWVSRARWDLNASYYNTILERLHPYWTVNYFNLDLEAYKPGVGAPTTENITANGYTVADVRSAMVNFLDAVVRSGVKPYMYPADPTDEVMPMIVDAAGGGIVSDESSSFGVERAHRRDPNNVEFKTFVGQGALRRSQILNKCGPLAEHRMSVFDDTIRIWGREFRSRYQEFEPKRGWIYLRTNTDKAHIGKSTWVTGETLHSFNSKVTRAWTLPDQGQDTILYSYGSEASVQLPFKACSASAVSNTGPVPLKRYNDGGITLDAPVVPNTHERYQSDDALETGLTTWGVWLRFKILSSATGDFALFGQAQYNLGIWQCEFVGGDIRVTLRGSPSNTSRTILAAPARDSVHCVYIGRNGNDLVRCADGGAVTRSAETWTATHPLVIFGAGQNPATFHATNNQAGCTTGLVLIEAGIVKQNASDAEIQAITTPSKRWPLNLV